MSTAINLLKDFLTKEPEGYYTLPEELVPIDGYRKAIFQYIGAVDTLDVEDSGEVSGWRVLKTTYVDPYPGVSEMDNYINYVAYVRPDFTPLTVQSLRNAIGAYRIIIGRSKVGIAESSTLDALWLSKGAAAGVVGEDPTLKVDVPITKIAIGAGALLFFGWLLFGKKKG